MKIDERSGNVTQGQLQVTKCISSMFSGCPKNMDGNGASNAGVAADAAGNVYIAQGAACCIPNRDNTTVNGHRVGPYSDTYGKGDAALMILSSDWTRRIHYNVFAAPTG